MTGVPFRFFPTVDNPYMFGQFPRFMINFSSDRWKNRTKTMADTMEYQDMPGRHHDIELLVDSGGFNELGKHGEYSFTVDHYLSKIKVLEPDAFATMDWMCEPHRLDATGLSVDEHIARTVDNAAEILDRWDGSADPFAVVQGWTIPEYLDCLDRLKERGCLTDRLGIGSICREEKGARIRDIVVAIRDNVPDRVELHGFGIKKTMLKDHDVVTALDSSDSMAWSKSNEKSVDLRGKDRMEYLGAWARDVEYTAYRTLEREKLKDVQRERGESLLHHMD